MTITLPKKLETRLFALYPDKEECQSVVASNFEKWLKIMEIMEKKRSPLVRQVVGNAKRKAKELSQNELTREKAYDQILQKVKKLDLKG